MEAELAPGRTPISMGWLLGRVATTKAERGVGMLSTTATPNSSRVARIRGSAISARLAPAGARCAMSQSFGPRV
ncbi:hypothetical protein QWZ10_04065 [Paracoccus cavernae]|uniref:Uncharacterized protein n=1 Tax=Paracoccus cavernae TaxID=1571207 RepID=A0ABT8D5V0_9RHOB|nr:hypothetical protein [Paracoccus cavernae]